MNERKASFDQAAKAYDSTFTHSNIGQLQRGRVYSWLAKEAKLKKSKKIFEINCGTGYDAAYLASKGHQVIATDASSKMISYAKSAREGVERFYQLAFKNVSQDPLFQESNVLFSNFGGLNCLSQKELKSFLAEISETQQSENLFVGVIMAKRCFMEDLYHFLKFKWKLIGRRNINLALKVNVDGVDVNTYYHSPKEVASYLQNYQILAKKPVAFFLPPSYLEAFFIKRKILLFFLNKLEQTFGHLSYLSSWADHYIIIAEKK